MKLTCTQMDILISFYLDGELSNNLRNQVEEHLKKCPICKAKYEIIKDLFVDMKSCASVNKEKEINKTEQVTPWSTNSTKYNVFKHNLSAYLDNEMNQDESVKFKKLTINNKNARKELEDSYRIRRLLHQAFKQTGENSKIDYSKGIIKQLSPSYNKDKGKALKIHLVIFFISLIGFIVLISFMSLI